MSSRYRKIAITPKKLDRIQAETTQKCIIVMAACLAEEYDFTDEQIIAFAKRFERYASAVDQKLITLKQIQDILDDEIDLKFRWL